MRMQYQDGDTIRFNGGKDEYNVRGMAKTQPKVIIEVDGEAVYVPVACVELVSRKRSNAEKVEYAKEHLRIILRMRPLAHKSDHVTNLLLELLSGLER